MQSAICTYLISITRRTRSQILLFESKISLASKYVANVFINSVYFGKVDFFLQLNIQQCTSSSTGKHPFRILTSRVYEFMQWRKNRNFKWVNDSQTRRLLGLFLLWIRSFFFINSKLSADFLIYVFPITSTSCCNFQTLCSMSAMTSAP